MFSSINMENELPKKPHNPNGRPRLYKIQTEDDLEKFEEEYIPKQRGRPRLSPSKKKQPQRKTERRMLNITEEDIEAYMEGTIQDKRKKESIRKRIWYNNVKKPIFEKYGSVLKKK
jgi:hypothetical protein